MVALRSLNYSALRSLIAVIARKAMHALYEVCMTLKCLLHQLPADCKVAARQVPR